MSNYEISSLIISAITASSAFIVVFIYYKQLKIMSTQLEAMQQSSNAQGGLSLINFLQNEEIRKARGIVRKDLSNKPFSKWSDFDKKNAASVVANYDVVGALLKHGSAPLSLIADNWGGKY